MMKFEIPDLEMFVRPGMKVRVIVDNRPGEESMIINFITARDEHIYSVELVPEPTPTLEFPE